MRVCHAASSGGLDPPPHRIGFANKPARDWGGLSTLGKWPVL